MARGIGHTMNIEILEPQNPRWLEILSQLPHDVYHLPTYIEIEAARTQTSPEAILIAEGENIFFAPYLLRSCQDIDKMSAEPEFQDIISPYGYPSFLLKATEEDTSNFANLALHRVKESLKSKGVCSAFFRLHPILSDRFAEIFESGTFVENGETVSVDLTLTESELWAHTRKGHQSTINKCKRLGLEARMVPFREYIDEFIDLYNETMDRVVAKDQYYFSNDYFSALLKLEDKLHLGIVEFENKMVCASLFFESCGIVQAHLGGTRTEALKMSPFNLLLHHARLWAKGRGNKFLHIGGGVGGTKEDRLYIFKSGFSRQRHPFLTARFIIDDANYQHLVEVRAQSLGVSSQELLDTNFFPAYRASL
jgi:hypothetical protein